MSAEGILDCHTCELFDGEDICPTVALGAIEKLIELDPDAELSITSMRQNSRNPQIRPVLAEECNYKKLRHANTKSGFGSVTY